MFDWLLSADAAGTLFINSLHTPFLDHWMWGFSDKWVWIGFYLLIVAMLYRSLERKSLLVVAICIALVFFLTDYAISHWFRGMVERFRPSREENPLHQYIHIVNGYRGGRYGFPSCHAANTFGLATLIWLVFRRRLLTMVMFGWAFFSSYSRVYMGVHYLGDVLVGGALAGLLAFGVYSLVHRFHTVGYRQAETATIFGNVSLPVRMSRQMLVATAFGVTVFGITVYAMVKCFA